MERRYILKLIPFLSCFRFKSIIDYKRVVETLGDITIVPGKTIEYNYHNKKYKIGLTKAGTCIINDNVGKNRKIDRMQVLFTKEWLINLFGKTSEKEVIKKAKTGFIIKDIQSIKIGTSNTEITITFEQKAFTCSIPSGYFHELLEKHDRTDIVRDKTALVEIYGEAQSTLDESSKNVYNKAESYIKGICIKIIDE